MSSHLSQRGLSERFEACRNVTAVAPAAERSEVAQAGRKVTTPKGVEYEDSPMAYLTGNIEYTLTRSWLCARCHAESPGFCKLTLLGGHHLFPSVFFLLQCLHSFVFLRVLAILWIYSHLNTHTRYCLIILVSSTPTMSKARLAWGNR